VEKKLITRNGRILSEMNSESALTYVWSVERYKFAVLAEFRGASGNK
jgi:hypothetical protein